MLKHVLSNTKPRSNQHKHNVIILQIVKNAFTLFLIFY